jgi:hypothetical protein
MTDGRALAEVRLLLLFIIRGFHTYTGAISRLKDVLSPTSIAYASSHQIPITRLFSDSHLRPDGDLCFTHSIDSNIIIISAQ